MSKQYPREPSLARAAVVSVPLATLRESASDDIAALAAHGGILAKDSTPILEYASGDADSSLQVNWVAANSDPIVFQLALPDLNDSEDLKVHMRIKSGGATDTPVIDADSYFNEGDTKVSDASAAITATAAEVIITIAAADIPSGAQTYTCELTPAAHTTDTVILSALWVEYERQNA